MRFTKFQIDEKIDQLRNKYLADADYKMDAVQLSLSELDNLLNATSMDDILYTADMLKDAIAINIMPIDQLRAEAIEELTDEYYNDNPSERNTYSKQLVEAGHRESDF